MSKKWIFLEINWKFFGNKTSPFSYIFFFIFSVMKRKSITIYLDEDEIFSDFDMPKHRPIDSWILKKTKSKTNRK